MPASPAVDTRANIAYAKHDGVTLLGDLYLPAAGGPFPALVAAHGGGWQAGARSAFQYWGPYLAARGYVLFAVSYRLAKKGHKTFPQAVTDLMAAVQFVRGSAAQIKVDPERIAGGQQQVVEPELLGLKRDAPAVLVAGAQLRVGHAQELVVVIAQGAEPGDLAGRESLVHGSGSPREAVRTAYQSSRDHVTRSASAASRMRAGSWLPTMGTGRDGCARIQA